MLKLGDIFGQEEAIGQLRRAMSTQRLAHGLIFAGPAGVGKGTAAQALAAWFLCEKADEADACGVCDSCRLAAAGTHPDLHLIYRQLIRLEKKDHKARDLSIDVIRKHLLEPAGRKSVQGRGKAFIIEEAETMTRDAANSMLKTLEEPEGRALIILLTDQPHALLPTILSRCQLIRFTPLPKELVLDQLKRRGVDEPTAKLTTTIAAGSLGLAIRFIEEGTAMRARELFGQLRGILENAPPQHLAEWLAAAGAEYAQQREDRDANVSKDQATREGVVLYLRLAAEYFRLRLPDMADPAISLKMCRMIDDIAQAQRYVEGNVNTSLVLENIANRLR